ncbi:hypothetical protein ACHAXM_007098, partial [Skeletonema potamos]
VKKICPLLLSRWSHQFPTRKGPLSGSLRHLYASSKSIVVGGRQFVAADCILNLSRTSSKESKPTRSKRSDGV